MDRVIIQDAELVEAIDFDNSDLNVMIALAKACSAILGTATLLNDLDCVPHSPANLTVTLQAGEIYKLDNIDGTDYGPIPPDTTHQIFKQGIALDSQSFSCPAPAGVGDSIKYLIQITYQDSDTDPESRPFYNAAPQTVDTRRAGLLVANLKTGTPDPSPITPTPDAGYVGAWVITVANGQTQIQSSDIQEYTSAPFISEKLGDKISEATGDARYAFKNSGVPTGTSFPYFGYTLPAGFLWCDNSAVSRTTYAALFLIITFTQTGSTTNGSSSVTGLSSTANMFAGMAVTGSGIPAATTILSVDSGSAITLSANATATASPSIRFYPHGAGDGTTTFNTPNFPGRTPIGAGTGSGLTLRKVGETGGEETHSLTENENGTHAHTIAVSNGSGATQQLLGIASQAPGTVATSSSGLGSPHNTMQPFLVSNFIIKT